MRKRYRRGVFIVVYIKKKNKIYYLLLKRKLHWKGWEFPKGGIEKNEKILDAVKREIKEETGWEALKIKKYNFSGKYKYKKKLLDRKNFCGQTFTLYSAEIEKTRKNKIKIDKKEHSKYKWLKFKKAIRKLTWANQKTCLKIVNQQLKTEKS